MKNSPTKNFTRYNPSVDFGLTDEDVFARVAAGKTNYVKNRSTKSYFKIFFDNLFTYFNLLSIVCFIALLSVSNSDTDQHLSNYGFVLIFSANIIIGIVQEIRAKLTVEKLLLVKTFTATVIRCGVKTVIPVSQLVIDDIVTFSAGDQIPADCVLMSGEVEANESLLTGEAVPVCKKEGDTLLSGSFIVSGSCCAIVDKVGKECYAQTLTIKARKFKKTRSELMEAMNKIIKLVGILIIPLAILTALVQHDVLGDNIPKIVTATTSVIIGMIPSGMFFLTTLALAVGIIKLASKKTLVQDMYSLEMLARVNLICLDKTGTITSGEMNVCNVEPLIEGIDTGKIIISMQDALASDNMTSAALRKAFSCDKTMTAKNIIAFSSERKFSAVDFGNEAYALGAPEFVLKDIPDNIKVKIEKEVNEGRRVLLLAKIGAIENGEITGEIIPAALIAIEDVIRPEAIQTINWFKENDVAVKVISGDDAKTVSQIAKKAGVNGAENFISLFGLSDMEVVAAASEYSVFGRVSPEQKALLIKTFKEQKYTVAMTGDGVNDILAMKEADCAVSVASGSSAAKNLSHIVLLSDDFNCMPEVVKEGRRVINNVQQSASLFLMKTLFTIVFAVVSIITWSNYPLSTGMMLPLEFFIIGLPSFFLSLQPNQNRVQGKFISHVLSNSVPGAVILVMNTLLAQYAYAFGLNTAGIYESIIVFALVFGGFVSLVFLCLPFNKYRFYLVSVVLILIALCINFADVSLFGQSMFEFAPLRLNEWEALLFLFALVAVDIPIFFVSDVISKKLGIKEKRKEKSDF